jgi:H+/Cl- antiporter ClcA
MQVNFTIGLRWLILVTIVGLLVGSASSFFLITLDLATDFREQHIYIIWGLPLVGFLIGWVYMKYGQEVVGGNKILVQEIVTPQKIISWKMAPLVYLGTIFTHLFGGSAGREGTALQMAGSIADQLSIPFKLTTEERRILIIMAVAAGFSSVFGTPLAGVAFSVEFFRKQLKNYWLLIPVVLVAFLANEVTHLWNVVHTSYYITEIPSIGWKSTLWALAAGIAFGLGSQLFKKGMHHIAHLFQKFIAYPPLKPVVGGLLIVASYYVVGDSRFLGLGIPTIEASFVVQMLIWVFLIKVLLTVITLSSGFKGGEVTPLFFMGATLGSALSFVLPLPTSLLAGMGFVGLFAGATHTPIACVLMGIELFGVEGTPYFLIACIASFLVSGKRSVYVE